MPVFRLEIELGNDAMNSGAAVAMAIRRAITRDLREIDLNDKRVGANQGKIFDVNGNSVGRWYVTREEL